MSSVNFLEKLLDGVEVEWKPLGNVIKLEKGRQLNKELLSEHGLYPAYNGGVSHSGFTDTFNYTENKTIVSQGGASAGFVNFVTSKFYANAHCYVLLPNTEAVVNRYVYHLLKLNQERLTGKQHGAGIPALRTSEILEIPIPIPCPENPKKSLEIQAEIVRILDTFTELTAELTAELNLRKKQYNYYRDQLLSFEEGDVEWKTLGDEEFFEVTSGGTPSTGKPEYWDNGNIPWLKSESCNNEPVYSAKKFITELGLKKSSAKLLQKETTLIALVGATIFKTAFLEFPAATNQNIASIKSKNSEVISDKFVFYFLASLYEKLKSEMRNYGMLNLSTLRQFKIPVPSPEEQTRIVAILDKFDALTNSITEGLPREIAQRQKQYEHYRNLLLSFPTPEGV